MGAPLGGKNLHLTYHCIDLVSNADRLLTVVKEALRGRLEADEVSEGLVR